MYFTPDGRYAIVVAERLRRLDFRDAHTLPPAPLPRRPVRRRRPHGLHRRRPLYLLASCEFSGQLVVVDVARRASRAHDRPSRRSCRACRRTSSCRPTARIFYVADMHAGGVWEIDAHSYRVLRLPRDRRGRARPLPEPQRASCLYVTNRGEGTVSVIGFGTAEGASRRGGSPAAARTWAASRPTARCSGSPAATTPRCTRSRPRTGTAARPDPRRSRAARPLRLAAARPLLARPHRHPPLAEQERARRCDSQRARSAGGCWSSPRQPGWPSPRRRSRPGSRARPRPA